MIEMSKIKQKPPRHQRQSHFFQSKCILNWTNALTRSVSFIPSLIIHIHHMHVSHSNGMQTRKSRNNCICETGELFACVFSIPRFSLPLANFALVLLCVCAKLVNTRILDTRLLLTAISKCEFHTQLSNRHAVWNAPNVSFVWSV